METPLFAKRLTRRAALVGAAVAVVLTACGPDPFAPVANRPTVSTTFQIWALTGSPPPYPTAFAVAQNAPVRLDPAGSFDIAFDITPDGLLKVLPVSKVVAPLTGTRPVGIIVAGVPYEEVLAAPLKGWATDSVVEVPVGATFIVQVTTVLCQFEARQTVYAKFYVDSIFPEERRARVSGRINPNCGFRSFADGTPEF